MGLACSGACVPTVSPLTKRDCMFVVIHTTLKITVGCEAQRTCPNIPVPGACKENLHAFFDSLVCVSERASKAEAKELKNSNDPAHQ